MQQELKPKRYLHVLGVQYISAALAMRYGADIQQAELAGLLHDCAKHLSDDIMLSECEKYQIQISEVEQRNPFLLHGKLGSCYANKKYQINSQATLDAIAYHTTGRPEMSLLEKIVYVADYIEPSRQIQRIPELARYRQVAFLDIDQAVYEITKHTFEYLTERGGEIDTITVETFEYYKSRLENRE